MPDSLFRIVLSLVIALALQQLGSAGIIHAKANLAPLLLARAWEESRLNHGAPVKPWPWADTWPVAQLKVPALGVSQFVLAGDTGNALAFGPGHNNASAPLGSSGLAMIGGHRDTHFGFLEHIQAGQKILLLLPNGRSRRYRVQQTIVDSADDKVKWPSHTEQLLLVTCYPFDADLPGGSQRYVVIAKPEPESEIASRALSSAALIAQAFPTKERQHVSL
ncbi:MAG: class GN sortase [Halioglobus sp.]